MMFISCLYSSNMQPLVHVLKLSVQVNRVSVGIQQYEDLRSKSSTVPVFIPNLYVQRV